MPNGYIGGAGGLTTEQLEVGFVDTFVTDYRMRNLIATEQWEKITTIRNPVVSSLSAYQQVDASFRSGEKGVFAIDFKMYPDILEGYLCRRIDGDLKRTNVKSWKPCEFKGNTFYVYFVTGIAPLAIAAIVLGTLVLIAAIVAAITVYKIKIVQTTAQVERQEVLLEEIINRTSELDADEALRILTEETEEERTTSEGMADALAGIFEKPIMTLVVMAGLVLMLFVFLKAR